MLPSAVLLRLPCLMLAFQLVSSYTTGACLQGFIRDMPDESTFLRYTSLTNNESEMKTFLFPSTAFLCNGTLQEVAVPYVVDSRDSLVWQENLTAVLSVWRPTTTGHMEVVRFQLTVHLPESNDDSLYVASNPHSGTIVIQPQNEVAVQRGDIIGITLTPYRKLEYIPLLLMRSTDSGSGEDMECGDINTTHNCNIIHDRTPLVAVNLTFSKGDVPSSATLEGIKPTTAHSCPCSREVSEVTRMLTIYVSVCSTTVGAAPHSSRLRQPPTLATATHDTKPDHTHTAAGTTASSTLTRQHTSTSMALANIPSIQTRQTTPSLDQPQPTPMTPPGDTSRDPQATGSGEAAVEHNGDKGGCACGGTLIASSAVLGATVVVLLIVIIILSVFAALLTMKVKQLKRARNMQGFVKTCNAYIDIEQKEKRMDSKDTDSKHVD